MAFLTAKNKYLQKVVCNKTVKCIETKGYQHFIRFTDGTALMLSATTETRKKKCGCEYELAEIVCYGVNPDGEAIPAGF